jgi:hypothetical protein
MFCPNVALIFARPQKICFWGGGTCRFKFVRQKQCKEKLNTLTCIERTPGICERAQLNFHDALCNEIQKLECIQWWIDPLSHNAPKCSLPWCSLCILIKHQIRLLIKERVLHTDALIKLKGIQQYIFLLFHLEEILK